MNKYIIILIVLAGIGCSKNTEVHVVNQTGHGDIYTILTTKYDSKAVYLAPNGELSKSIQGSFVNISAQAMEYDSAGAVAWTYQHTIAGKISDDIARGDVEIYLRLEGIVWKED